jgi:4'-phosphopantetheinyl transferase
MTAEPRRLPVPTFGASFWLVDLSGIPGAEALRSLSSDERERAARFVFEEHRRRYQVAHGALRVLLGQQLGLEPDVLSFVTNRHGKPFLPPELGCAFNMGHSDEFALIACAPGRAGFELGVDIEAVRTVRDAADLALLHFTPSEQNELSACPVDERNRLFLSGWTRKEACLKAVGSGLSISPSTFECGLAAVPASTRIVTADGTVEVLVESIDVDSGHLAAVATTARGAAR